jgi:hypothetical protein
LLDLRSALVIGAPQLSETGVVAADDGGLRSDRVIRDPGRYSGPAGG